MFGWLQATCGPRTGSLVHTRDVFMPTFLTAVLLQELSATDTFGIAIHTYGTSNIPSEVLK